MRVIGRTAVVTALIAALLAAVPIGPAAPAPRVSVAAAPSPRADDRRGPEIDRDHVVVRMRTTSPAVGRRLAAAGVRGLRAVPGTAWTALETDGRADRVRSRLASDPAVIEVRPSYLRRASTIPDDPLWATGQRPALSPLRMDRAWDLARGNGVTVAVLDSGVDFDHPDLQGRVITPGLNLLTPGGARDDSGHGTMVAGIIAANRGNRRGIAGVAPGARILPVKVLDRDGIGDDVDIATGMAWAVARGADIINLSLGGPGESPLLTAAVANARAMGVVVVAAAGNSGNGSVEVPAAIPGVLAVSATGNAGGMAAFSSYGPEISVAAPGVRITSTDLGRPSGSDAYSSESGTSFAAPIVAGVAALVRSRFPGLSAEAVAARIRNTARDRGPAGVDDAYGHGVVDPVAALGGRPVATRAVFRTFPDADAGDLPETALAITVGVPHAALISPETDEDWYRIALAPGWYRVALPPPTRDLEHSMDPIIELYDSGLAFRATQEFGGGALAIRIFRSGIYVIRVRNRNPSTAPYSLNVTPVTAVALFEGAVPFDLRSAVGSVGIADVTGDGRADAIGLAGSEADVFDTLVVAPQAARRTFAPLIAYPAPDGVVGTSLVVGDATGDGKSDVVFAAAEGIVIIGQGVGGLTSQRILRFDGYEHFALADIDDDDRPDLVAGGPAGLRIFWGASGTPFTASSVLSTVPAHAVAATAGGMAAVRVGGVVYYRATGRTLAAKAVPLSSVRALAFDPVGGDLVVTRGLSPLGSVRVLRPGPGAPPTLTTVRTLTLGAGDPGPVVVADVDGGGSDVVTLHRATGEIGVIGLTGGPARRFAADPTGGAPYGSRALAVGDLDGDGLRDALVATDVGLRLALHRLDVLPAVYGRALVTAAEPVARRAGVLAAVRPRIALSAAATNAVTTVRLVGRHGAVIPAAVAGLGTDRITLTTPVPLARGAYAVRITGLVGVGGDRTEHLVVPFTVGPAPDQRAPTVAFTARPTGTVAPGPQVVRFSSPDPTATFACSIDNRPYAGCRSPLVVPGGTGRHSVLVFARDPAGNESSAIAASWRSR